MSIETISIAEAHYFIEAINNGDIEMCNPKVKVFDGIYYYNGMMVVEDYETNKPVRQFFSTTR